MSLIIYNGSPRNKKSNSKLLIDKFLVGYHKENSDEIPVYYLANRRLRQERIEHFKKAETILLFFPLYTDAMPGIVKEFLEDIYDLKDPSPKKIGFIVQSGFPEAVHSSFLERYLKKFTNRMGYDYLGTIIKGGVEGIQIMPASMTKKLFKNFENLGEYFAKNGAFNPTIKESLATPFRMSTMRKKIFKLLSDTGVTNFYWNSQLKKNSAYDKRFDQPYLNKPKVVNSSETQKD